MVMRVSRRIFLGGMLGALAEAGQAAAPGVSLRPRQRPAGVAARAAPEIETLIRAARLDSDVCYAVVDLQSGTTLEARNPRAGKPPASVTKMLTTLYALDALGPDFRFETRLLATGPLRDGVLEGDLILAGGGDPTLDTDALARMAAELKRLGLRELRGRLRVWAGALPFKRMIDRTQPEQAGYNPALSGLNLNYNRVRFEWKRAGADYALTLDARTARYRPEVRVARISAVTRNLPVYTYADRGDHDQWTVARVALGNGGERWLPVRKPEAYAAEVFATLARAHGILMKTGAPLDAPPEGRVLVTRKSAALQGILQEMLKYSTNLTAELVGMTATAHRLDRPVTMRASAREMSRWARAHLGLEGASLVDHSGLGIASRLSAGALAGALARSQQKQLLRPMLKEFSLRAEAPENDTATVMAKTGTLYFVSALAGYVTPGSGRDLAFAIFTADTDRRAGFDPASGQRPPGARGWTRRSRKLQRQLIARWGRIYQG